MSLDTDMAVVKSTLDHHTEAFKDLKAWLISERTDRKNSSAELKALVLEMASEQQRRIDDLEEKQDAYRDELTGKHAALREEVVALQKAQLRNNSLVVGFGGGISILITLLREKLLALFAIVLTLLLAGCADVGPNGARRRWHEFNRPADVALAMGMGTECEDSALRALAWWQDRVDYLRPAFRPPSWDGFKGDFAPVGVIAIGLRPEWDKPYMQSNSIATGVTYTKHLRKRIRSARIYMRYGYPHACDWQGFAHEIGHALGLEHHPDRGHLMHPVLTQSEDPELDPEELDWVR